MFAHAWSHIRARHNYKQLPVGHALSACILAANLNPELRQSLLLHLQQNRQPHLWPKLWPHPPRQQAVCPKWPATNCRWTACKKLHKARFIDDWNA
jgi:hypothetical protein